MPRENVIPFILQVVLPWLLAAVVIAVAVAGNVWVVRRVYFPQESPEEFNGRAEAVVTGYERSGGGGPNPPDVDVMVDYSADGRRVTGAELRGDGAMGHSPGDTLTIAYHPESPDLPFTLETLEQPGPIARLGAVVPVMLFGALWVWVAPAWAAEVSCLETRWWMRRAPTR
ncbi:DUF3592 domain-containing protein [Nocardiopsis chromatogenes]|uniref:DUF3592 domain-containing protein n=1 Tax=Nocardiopsis chromatogenes TaxID=280239 RepID=UPI00034D0366|nr:DUF3592 domain-containing protein [Nocardiopsis chromatogenes]